MPFKAPEIEVPEELKGYLKKVESEYKALEDALAHATSSLATVSAEKAALEKSLGAYQTASQRSEEMLARLLEEKRGLEDAMTGYKEKMSQLEQMAKEAEEAKIQAQQASLAALRWKIIAAKYPSLAPLEERGILNVTGQSPEEIEESMKLAAEAIASAAKQSIAKDPSGSVPTASASGSAKASLKSTVSPQEILAKAMSAYASGDMATYDTLYTEYLRARSSGQVVE